jgi:hypothetical protein
MTTRAAEPVTLSHGFRLGTAVAACALSLGSLLPARAHDHGGGARLAPQEPGGAGRGIYVPGTDVGVATMEIRRHAQRQTLWRFAVFYDFRFTDRRAESGITFKHRIVDDAGRDYKAVHYDHGNGLAAADVDGDGLTDLYFLSQLGGNELWKNLGAGRFANLTAEAAVALADRVSVAASFADADNDGDPDLFVTTVRGGNVLFENDGSGRFRDRTVEAGVGHVGHSSGAVFFDYDRDGRLDLLVTNVGKYTGEERGRGGYWIGYGDAFSGHLYPERTEMKLLYRNLGGLRFEDVSQATGLVDGSWSGDATFTDFNGDFFPDLYLPNMQGDDHYWENAGGRRFVERTAAHFPKSPWGAMGVKFFDFDNDGRQDLFLTDMHSDMSQEVPPGFEEVKSLMAWPDDFLQGGADNLFGNALWRNLGGGRFEEISDRVGAENYWPWGLSTGDLNADGFDDAFITAGMNYPWRYGINSLLLNNRGETFLDAEYLLAVEPRRDGPWRPWFELECSSADRDHPLCRGQIGRQTVYGTAGSRSSVILDLEGDGDLDIVTGEFGDLPQVLVSNLSERRGVRSISVKLVGRRSNRDGLGATVTVHAGGRAYARYHDGKSGYLAQSSLPLYVGLGDADEVERVEVLWPSGAKQTVTRGLALNRVIEIVEP